MLLLRAHVLALGHSGVRPEVVDLMVAMLNEDVIRPSPSRIARRVGRSRAAREPRPAADRPWGRAVARRRRGTGRRRVGPRGLSPLTLQAKRASPS